MGIKVRDVRSAPAMQAHAVEEAFKQPEPVRAQLNVGVSATLNLNGVVDGSEL